MTIPLTSKIVWLYSEQNNLFLDTANNVLLDTAKIRLIGIEPHCWLMVTQGTFPDEE